MPVCIFYVNVKLNCEHEFLCNLLIVLISFHLSTATASAAASGCGGGGWVQSPATGRCYKFIDSMTVNWGTAQSKCSLFGGRLATLRTLDDMIFVNGYRVTRHGKLDHFIPPRFTIRDCGSAKLLKVNNFFLC